MGKRNDLRKDVDKFLADGGKIEQVPYDQAVEDVGRFNFNAAMGDPVHDQVERRKYGEELVDLMHDLDLQHHEWETAWQIETMIEDSFDYFPVDEQEDWY